VGYYSRIVKEKAVRRELIHSAASMQEEAFAADDDADVILDHAESKLAGVRTRATVSSGLELFDSAEEMENATPLSFAVEGFLQCDAATLIAGLSGQYKTWLALCLMKSMLDESQKLWSTFPVLNKANRVVYLVPESARGPFRYLDDINPIHGVSIPRSKEPEETYAYSLDEVKKILARLDEPGKTVVLTAALTGLRKGEIRGLRWEDFNGKQLNVNRCVWNSIVNEPKTARSRAAVPVMRELADALEGHRERMGKLAAGPIFQAGNGKPLNLDNFARRVIIPAIEKCVRCRKSREDHKPEAHMFELDTSLQWRGWHSFRRGLATNLHAIGVDDKTIQQILRHSNIAMTQNVYIKSLAASGVSAMDLLGAEMRKEAACNNLATNQQQRPN
jgi:integrase